MTNLAEGFMLISEQEKSGKVERREKNAKKEKEI